MLRPVGVPDAAVKVTFVEPLDITLVGLKEAVTPLGNPDTANVIAPLKPVAGTTVIVSLPGVAGVMVTLAEDAVSLKVVVGVTEKLWDTGGAAA